MTAGARPHVAVSDCEEIRPGWLGQPANALSSVVFVIAAVPIVRWARRREGGGRRWPWLAVGASTAVAGVGSLGYHGPGDPASKVVHDIGIDAMAASLVGSTVWAGDFRRLSARTAVLGVAALVLHQLSQTGRPLCSYRSPIQGHAIFHLLAAAAVVSVVDDQIGPEAFDPPIRTTTG